MSTIGILDRSIHPQGSTLRHQKVFHLDPPWSENGNASNHTRCAFFCSRGAFMALRPLLLSASERARARYITHGGNKKPERWWFQKDRRFCPKPRIRSKKSKVVKCKGSFFCPTPNFRLKMLLVEEIFILKRTRRMASGTLKQQVVPLVSCLWIKLKRKIYFFTRILII